MPSAFTGWNFKPQYFQKQSNQPNKKPNIPKPKWWQMPINPSYSEEGHRRIVV
jgi:hypothetical protein